MRRFLSSGVAVNADDDTEHPPASANLANARLPPTIFTKSRLERFWLNKSVSV